MNVYLRYWQCFTDLKRDALYVDLYLRRTENIDRYMNMFLAATSSSSVGAWAVWQKHELVWGTLIAASQVLNAVKSYIPYSKRLRNLAGLSPDINALALVAESDWFKVCRGELDEAEINNMHIRLKKKSLDLVQKHFKGSSLPSSNALEKKAGEICVGYMAAYFGGANDEEE